MRSVVWDAIGGVAATITVGVTLAGNFWGRWRRYRQEQGRREKEDALLRVAVFGRKSEGPLPEIRGLLGDQEDLRQQVAKLRSDMDVVLRRTAQLEGNGGTSLADQIRELREMTGEIHRWAKHERNRDA